MTRGHHVQSAANPNQARRRSEDSVYSSLPHDPADMGRASMPGFEAVGNTTLDPAHPREWHTPVATISTKAYRQLLGLNPFKTSYMSLYGSLDTYSDKLVACGGGIFAIAAGLPLPIIGVIFGKLISAFPPSEDELNTRITQLLGVAVAYFVVTALYAMFFGFTGEKIAMKTREQLLSCLMRLDQAYLDTHELDVNSLLNEKVDAIHAGCSEKAGIFIQSICYFVAAFTVGFILSPKLTGILLAAIIPTLSIVVKLASVYGARFSKRVSAYSEVANGILESALGSIKVVQAFGMMSTICTKHSAVLGDRMATSMRKALVTALQVGCIYFLIYSVNGLAFYVGSRMAASGEHGGNAGTVFAVVFLILDSSLVVAQFAPILEIFAQAAAAQEAIQVLLDALPSETSTPQTRLAHCDLHGRTLVVRDVVFKYPARPTVKALDGLSLECKPGCLTALVGTSGGGKSTLVSLLTGAYDYSGSIHFDSHELRSMAVADLRAQMAVVEQQSVLFTGTIYDNICHGVQNLALPGDELDRRCNEAVRRAHVDFIAGLPNGIHTRIGDGLQLSGGQQQRICLARALIRDPAVLILDEPTSALDARSEVAVMTAVREAAAAGITVIMIAHRLSTILEAHHVAVLCDGKVAEQGKPSALVERNGMLKSLLDAQNTALSVSTVDKSQDEVCEKGGLHKSSFSLPDSQDRIEDRSDEESLPNTSDTLSIGYCARQLASIILPDWPIIALGLLGSIASGGLLLGEAIIFGNLVQLLNDGVSTPQFQEHANFFCLMFFVLGCIGLVSWVSSGTAFGVASSRTVGRIQSRLLRTLLFLDMEWFNQPDRSVGHLMSVFSKDTGDIACLSGAALGTIFTTITSIVGGMILALIVAWKIAVVLLAAVPVMLVAGFLRLRVLGASDARRRTAYNQATSLATEACRNRRTVAVYGLEAHILDEYHKALQRPFENGRLFLVFSNLLLAMSFAITYFVYALAYWWGSKQVRNGSYSSKDFFIVLPALLFSAQSSGQLFSLSPEIARARAAAASVLRLLSYHPQILAEDIQNQGELIKPSTPASDEDQEVQSKIEFRVVSLAYSSGDTKLALREVSFAVHANTSIGLVGPSGAGKSSTIALMERFYDPAAGTVLFDGIDARELDVDTLRDRIGLVSQEPNLLPGSIDFNIRLGARKRQQVTKADIEDVCKRCGLHDFISSLPEGYNTDCGSNSSSKLSGGQRQRVALARALIRQPEILLLDEPTSALDAHSEQHIQATLDEASRGRTTITVAHRLASVMQADKIFVFDHGRVVEQGTHSELVRQGGLYASMAKTQSLI